MKPKPAILLAPLLLSAPFLLAREAPPTPSASRPQHPDPVWATTFDEAVARARAMPEGRILVELRDPECSDCDRMAELVYPTPSFRAFVQDKVPVRLLRNTPDGQRISARFGVSSSPAWLVLTPDLLLSGKQEGASNQPTWIERFVATERGWALFRQKLAEEKKAPTDPAAAFAVGEEAFRRLGDAMAEERFRRVADDPKADAGLRERSLAYLAAIAFDARRFDDAARALDGILATAKDPALRQKAELRLADVDLGLGDRVSATRRLESFLQKYPDSPLRSQAEAVLKAIGTAKP